MSFAPREYLRHIADEAAYLEQATTGVNREAFLKDPTLQRQLGGSHRGDA